MWKLLVVLALVSVLGAVAPGAAFPEGEWLLTPSHRTSELGLAHQFAPVDNVSFMFRREVEGNYCRQWEGKNRRRLSKVAGESNCTAAVIDARPHDPEQYTCILVRVWFAGEETPAFQATAHRSGGAYRCAFEGVPAGLYYMQLLDVTESTPKHTDFVSVGVKPFASLMAMKVAKAVADERNGRVYTDFVLSNLALENESVQLVTCTEDIAMAVNVNDAVPLFHIFEGDEGTNHYP